MPDPYDNYDFIRKVHEPYANFPLYFILFADYGINDNNVTVTARKFHQLLRDLDKYGGVGIHPSLSSGKYPVKFEDEYEGLCEVLDRDVNISRQHFLKLSMPKTYRTLMQFGITGDYSMGYASHIGFRAGIAIPFPFFDLMRNETTTLMIHPVSLMDVTLKDYLRLSKVESLERIENMIQTIRSVNGEFVSLWHNESLGDTGRWEGWREVYQEMVKMASG
ncbi:MAG: polysaccharide deacetylase family protein [Bacteroidetes bacterium]|nr:polysaccharide deacetylase family protein [Bacteroidota bacterium]